jgi:histidine triad (HIT) family protein
MENDCVFCKIVKKEIPADIIYEDKKSLAFLDINPVNTGHVLVIPKEHYKNIYETPDEVVSEAAILAKKMASIVKEAVHADGINIIMSNDVAADQSVFHSHLHVIPRYLNDGFKMWVGRPYTEGEKETTAEKIRKEIR